MNKPLIFICSPYRGDIEANLESARYYCRFAVQRGGIPFAPHLLYTQFLDDSVTQERNAGLSMGLEMLTLCNELWAFGPATMGMAQEITEAVRLGVPVRRFDLLCREEYACE